MRKLVCLAGVLLLLLALPLSVAAETENAEPYIQRMIRYYLHYQEKAEREIAGQLERIAAIDPDQADVWEKIMGSWAWANSEMEVNEGVLPDGLPEDDSLCIVVLGFGLNPNGSMKPELIDRLQVALASSQKYPNAYVLCTGGETAYDTPGVSEAGEMGAWLLSNGIDAGRLILEDRSLSTTENARNTHALLTNAYPQVKSLALITSDYHIRWGCAMFTTVSHYAAYQGGRPLEIVGNAFCATDTPDVDSLSTQASGIGIITGIRLDNMTAPALYLPEETTAPQTLPAETEAVPAVPPAEPEEEASDAILPILLLAAAVLAGAAAIRRRK